MYDVAIDSAMVKRDLSSILTCEKRTNLADLEK
jgi:hypothetical protein